MIDYSPGPWRVVIEDGDTYILDANSRYVAQTTYDMQSKSMAHPVEADSALIAAAPIMLQMLKELQSANDECPWCRFPTYMGIHDDDCKLNAAIKAAIGE